MSRFIVLLLIAVAAMLGGSAGASAQDGQGGGAVFVQTNEPSGNRIVVYQRGPDGTLSQSGSYATGGNGGVALPGVESDHLGSQGSLVLDHGRSLLFAVNAGSDTLSVFSVQGTRLSLEQVIASGGRFPASIAVHDNTLYVVNAGDTGVLQGFRIVGKHLEALPGSTRDLGLANSDPPVFLTSPGQVGFTPDGRQLVVTEKGSGDRIDVFAVQPNGQLSAAPTVNTSATPVPFAFTFEPAQQRLVVSEAGLSALSTYRVGSDGTLTDPHSLPDNQATQCWVTRVRGFYYVSNTNSNTISGYTIGADGQPALIGATGVVGTTELGPVDSAASGGEFFYVQTGGSGTVDEFRVEGDGGLTKIGTVTGLPPGQEGIAAD
jgi:6-phosphogluconolactonase (cycloisomerase 2 family)